MGHSRFAFANLKGYLGILGTLEGKHCHLPCFKKTRGLSRGWKKIISDSTWWRSSLRFDLENLESWSGGFMKRSILLHFKGLRNLTNKNICCNCEFIDKTFVSSQNWQVYRCLPLLCLVLCPVLLSFVQHCCSLSSIVFFFSIVVLCPVLCPPPKPSPDVQVLWSQVSMYVFTMFF